MIKKKISKLKRLLRRFWRLFLTDQKVTFGVAFIIGVLMAIVLHIHETNKQLAVSKSRVETRPYDFAYEKWLQRSRGLEKFRFDPDSHRYNTSHNEEETSLHPDSEAFYLAQNVRVACFVFPENFASAIAVRDTWGQHCNKIYLLSSKLENDTIPIEKVNARSSFDLLCKSFHRIREDVQDFDWYFTATDNTFALIENLRYFVAPKNASANYYLGHAMQFWGELYNWGDAGYVLSRGTVETLLKEFDTDEKCKKGGRFWKNGDWYLGKHLRKLKIEPEDTRDHMGRGRFNGYSFKKLLFPGVVSIFERYWRDSLYLSEDGPHCCSNFAVTFHGILSHSKMYQLEYMFHHLRPFYAGGVYGNSRPAKHGPLEKFLTLDEKLKDEHLGHLMDVLLTTPKAMAKLMKEHP